MFRHDGWLYNDKIYNLTTSTHNAPLKGMNQDPLKGDGLLESHVLKMTQPEQHHTNSTTTPLKNIISVLIDRVCCLLINITGKIT